jgi:hypothetical protein
MLLTRCPHVVVSWPTQRHSYLIRLPSQGLLAPVLASCSLFGLYLLVKYVPEFSLQTFLDAYFWLLGSVAIFGAGELVRDKKFAA